jgi:hypothetical protein
MNAAERAEQAFIAYWQSLPDNERVAVFHKEQVRKAFLAGYNAADERAIDIAEENGGKWGWDIAVKIREGAGT